MVRWYVQWGPAWFELDLGFFSWFLRKVPIFYRRRFWSFYCVFRKSQFESGGSHCILYSRLVFYPHQQILITLRPHWGSVKWKQFRPMLRTKKITSIPDVAMILAFPPLFSNFKQNETLWKQCSNQKSKNIFPWKVDSTPIRNASTRCAQGA